MIFNEFSIESLHPKATESSDFLCGVEYEIEALYDYNELFLSQHGISVTMDGSLRNNGREFITAPTSFNKALLLFKLLHTHLQLVKECNPYTERTSIHVHVNVAMLEQYQVQNLIKLYTLLEPVFFLFAGEGRKNNIHCVPLTYTSLNSYYSLSLEILINKWSKYTAFNIRPILEYGTVEFRHLYGTGDYTVFKDWLSMLYKLYKYATLLNVDSIKEFLYSKKSCQELYELVFGIPCPLLENDFTTNKLDVKLAYI